MTATGYTIAEIKANITVLNEAYQRAAKSGGVTSYTLNSGQGSSSVQQASLSTIRTELNYWKQLLQEENEYGSGSHCTFIRDAGAL
jgi:hypothetical protein|nr:MAG TPA: hypothetical protein [Caudoviricetes sp.]